MIRREYVEKYWRKFWKNIKKNWRSINFGIIKGKLGINF